MTRSLLVLIVAGVAALASACAPTEQERAEQVCTAFCGCMAPPLPALQEQCMGECRMEINTSRFSDECVSCISANADRCATLEQVCEPICDPPRPDDQFPDAGVPF